jgi:WD40 repeat protein
LPSHTPQACNKRNTKQSITTRTQLTNLQQPPTTNHQQTANRNKPQQELHTKPSKMKVISPNRTTVTSFSNSSTKESGFEYDASDYVLSISSQTSNLSSASVAAALSNQCIIQYDSNNHQVVQRIEKAHDGPISEICYFPPDYFGLDSNGHVPSTLLISASQDGTVKIFDLRSKSSTSPAITSKLQLPNEQALTVSLGFGGTLAAVGTNKSRISFFDLRYSSGNKPSGQWMGNYVDAHTDEVTRVRFQTVIDPNTKQQTTILATASEDGLLSIHDPSQTTEEAALVSVLNIGSPLRDIGFFGPNYEGVFALTGNETMSVWHWDSAQKISDCGGDALRGLLSNAVSNNQSMDSKEVSAVEYLVGCDWRCISDNSTEALPALHLMSGNSQGDGYIFRVDANQITPMAHMKGGHKGCIRDFCWSNGRLITGGEDARICEWDISGDSFCSGSSQLPVASGSGKVRRDKSSKGSASSEMKGKKKFGSPY